MPVLKPKANNAEKLSAALGSARERYINEVNAVVDTATVRNSDIDAQVTALRIEQDQLDAVIAKAKEPVA